MHYWFIKIVHGKFLYEIQVQSMSYRDCHCLSSFSSFLIFEACQWIIGCWKPPFSLKRKSEETWEILRDMCPTILLFSITSTVYLTPIYRLSPTGKFITICSSPEWLINTTSMFTTVHLKCACGHFILAFYNITWFLCW